jgi:hypothetical protein
MQKFAYEYRALAITVTGFVGALLLALSIPPDNTLFDFITAVVLMGCVAFYAFSSMGVLKRRLPREGEWKGTPKYEGISEKDFAPFRKRIRPNEDVLWTDRRNVIMLAWSIPLAVGMLACIIAARYMQFHHTSIGGDFQTQFTLGGSSDEVPKTHVGVAVWWGPLLLCLPFTYGLGALHEGWKWKVRIITDHMFNQRLEQSAWMPWLGKDNEPIPVRQIVKVKDYAGMWGGLLRFATVEIEYRTGDEKDKSQYLTLRLVRHGEEFADTLRSVVPEYDEPAEEVPAPRPGQSIA